MSIAGIAGMATSLLGAASSAQTTAQCYAVPIKSDGSADMTIGIWAFQYFPESVQWTSGAEYATRQVLGGSHPLYQWICGKERVFTMSLEFTRDLQGTVVQPASFGPIKSVPPGSIARDQYNVDIAQAIAWVESLCAVDYGPAGQYPAGYDPPPLVNLVLPNMKLGRTRGAPSDTIQSILLQLTGNIDSAFPDGTPRHARLDLAFAETAQHPTRGIAWSQRSKMATKTAGGQAYGVGVAKRATS